MKSPLTVVALGMCLCCSCTLFVSKADYADYRAVRLAATDGARLQAMQRYVANNPDGHFYAEVQKARAAREQTTYDSGKGTRAGLERYLAAFPDGTFVAQARSRLSAIDLIERSRESDKARQEQLEAERALRDAELRRTWVTRFAGYWSKTLLGLSAWGSSIADVARGNPAFSRAFGAEPKPRCTVDECVKYYDSPFAVPVPGGTRIERTLSLVLRLRLVSGKLDRAELLFPKRGFSRWYELEEHKPVFDLDADARTAALTWAMAALQPIVVQLGSGVADDTRYEPPPIPPPAIGPRGEIVDTSAEDPSAPPNRLTSGAAPGPEDVNALVAPKAAEPAADMVFAPVQIDRMGRAVAPQTPAAAAPAADEPTGGDMVMAPMVIGKPGEAPATPPPAAAAPEVPAVAPAATTPGVVKAFVWNGLRVVLFAASGDAAAPAYDGVIIERASARKTSPTRSKAAKPAAKAAQTQH